MLVGILYKISVKGILNSFFFYYFAHTEGVKSERSMEVGKFFYNSQDENL